MTPIARRLPLALAVLALASAAMATTDELTVDVVLGWSPCATQDEDGNPRPEAVRYGIYATKNANPEEYLCQVGNDSTCTVELTRGVTYKIRVVGYDAVDRPSPPSAWSDPIYYESQLTGVGELPASGVVIESSYPNPFNPLTRIRFAVGADQAGRGVTIEVLDLRGRVVRELVSGPRPAGHHEVEWNGKDDRGRRLSSGPYLLRLRAAGQQQIRPITLVR